MIPNFLFTWIAVGAVAVASMQTPENRQQEPSRQDELTSLIAEFEEARKTFQALPSAARQKADSPYKSYPPKVFAFAQRNFDDASLAACEFLLRYPVNNNRRSVVALATEQHLEKPGIGDFLGELIHGSDDSIMVDQCLEQAIRSDNPRTRLYAKFGLARLMMDRRDWCLRGDTDRYADCFDEDQIAEFQSEVRREKIVELLREVITDSAELPYRDGRLVDFAQQSLSAAELEIGRPVPNVEGVDSSGKSFQLTDYLGKVVVITFWANWCGVCMDDLPEEIEFVTKMKGRPMVWLGVNGDEDRELFRQTEIDKRINFRSWHDGNKGPIEKRFGISGWPTMIVIDQEGIIRYKSRITVELEKAKPIIESLVLALETDEAKGNGK